MSPLNGPRTGHNHQKLDTITTERALTKPHRLAARFTKFKQNFQDPIAIPGHVTKPTRGKQDARYFLDVGQIPED